ncbi:hypothetical protein GJAV_G00151540 [Gymnothorax javanicus]|nr:hypothetical protein GJAV_G00151540 [Gymnothorax javanicus]
MMDAETSGPADNKDEHPWPYLKEMFDFIEEKESSYLMQCLLCLPIITELSAFKNSPSNLKKHVERKHAPHLKRYAELTSNILKRKRSDVESPSTSKQTAFLNSKRVFQMFIDRAVMKYVVYGLQPFSLVEQEPFQEFVKELQPNSSIISRPALCSMVDAAAKEMKKRVTEAMRRVDHIATTTDCWTVGSQRFIGVTAHWIDRESLTRCSAALARQPLEGPHTFDALASTLNKIYSEFEIQGKIVGSTADNGWNFLKASQDFGEDETGGAVNGGDVGVLGEEDNEEEIEVDFVNVTALLSGEDGSLYQLPKHHCCACHLLNLVCTVDAAKATSSEAYQKFYCSTFDKCYGLWNKCGSFSLSAKHIQGFGSLQLLRPNPTKWNSVIQAVESLLTIVKAKGEATIRSLCANLQVTMFNPAELEFLMEYASIMSPVAQAIDTLLAETNALMGWLLPTIHSMISKLDGIKVPLKYCQPLVDAVKLGIENRFSHMLKNPELIAASILVPKFKMAWTKDHSVIRMGIEYIKEHIEEPSTQQGADNETSSSDEDTLYFSSVKLYHALEKSKQLDQYLACPADDMELLRCFPAVCKLFVKLNTPLPSSAACDRLFGVTGPVFRPGRTRMDSQNFENQLLLKLNHTFFSLAQ